MSDARASEILIEHSLPQERLDVFLRGHFPAASRGAIQRLIEEGHITINGQPVKPTHHPRAGEVVKIHWPEARPATPVPWKTSLNILFEDESLLVLNKPPGMVVHPASGHELNTLVNALLHHCAGQLSGIGGVARPGIVHRLDKDTSGCLVVAKNDSTHMALSSQFASRQVGKIYHSILCGTVPRESGEIRAAIARHVSHRKRMAAADDGEGRAAHTSYRVLQRLKGATLAEARIHTGRTHQIRVHFQFLGFPVVGDLTYGQRQNARLKDMTSYAAERQMLHASQLAFTHPRTGQEMVFESPWPEDFRAALHALKLGGGD